MPLDMDTTFDLNASAADALVELRARRPLVHNITNFVVMNETANALLCIGASPVMAHAREELREMVGHAGALVLNIGTLEPAWIESMLVAGKEANLRGVPVVLDPVGAGATTYRTESAERILSEVQVSVLRGNAAELAALAGQAAEIRGVDAVTGDPLAAAAACAERFGLTAVASGPVDALADRERQTLVANGHALLGQITGSGCIASALIGAFHAVQPDPLLAATTAMVALGVAGEIAAERSAGPGSFRPQLMDALAGLSPATLRERARISLTLAERGSRDE